MKRKLFLGIGGSGCKVAELYSHACAGRENVRFLGIDADIEAIERINNIPTLSLVDNVSLGNVIDKLEKETIVDWFPCDEKDGKVGYFRSLEMCRGANGWRMKGLLSFEYMLSDDEKRRVLIGELEQLVKAEKDKEKSEEIELEVYVIASSCGGTGSALAIAIPMYIKRYVKSVFSKEVKVKALLANPEIYEGSLTAENRVKARANAYATFREINSIDLVSRGYNDTAKDLSKSKVGLKIGSEKSKGMGLLFDSNLPEFNVRSANPFDKVYIFNRVVGEASISSHEQIMAKVLDVINDEPCTDNDGLYSTISISEVVFERDNVIDYVIKQKTYDELNNEWTWLYDAFKRLGASEEGALRHDSSLSAFAENFIEAYKQNQGANRFFEYLALNRVGSEEEFEEYKTDSPEITATAVEDYIKKLIAYVNTLVDYQKFDDLKKQIDKQRSEIKDVKLFDSKSSKQAKSQKFYEFVEEAMQEIASIHKYNILNLSENVEKALASILGTDSEISLEKSLLKFNDRHVHPVMALLTLCLLYMAMGKDYTRVVSTDITTPYDDDILPLSVLKHFDMNVSSNPKYDSLEKPRLHTILKFDENSISKEIIKSADLVKEEIKNVGGGILDCFVVSIMKSVYNKIGELIEGYIKVIGGVKGLVEEHRVDVKITLMNNTTDSCTKMNVGCTEEQKTSVYSAYVDSETKQEEIDGFAGKLVYDAVCSNSSVDLFEALYQKRMEVSKDNAVIAKIASTDIFRVLHDRDLLKTTLSQITEFGDFKQAFSFVALPVSIDMKNDQEHQDMVMEVETIVSKGVASFAKEMLGKPEFTDQQAIEKYVFDQSRFESKITVSETLPENKIYSIRKINNLKPWFFDSLNDDAIGSSFYVDYLKALMVKEQQFTQMWNPHLVKENLKGDYLLFVNPNKQIKFEKGVYKAILYMLDKGLLLVNVNHAKKDIFYYKEASNDAEPIEFEGKPVLFENIYDLFGFARQNAELTIKYANLFDEELEKECSALELNVFDGASLPKIKNGIMKSDLVRMMLGDIFASVRSINKIQPKRLLDFIYDLNAMDKYKFETVNFISVIREVLIYMIKYRTSNNEESFEKLYLDTMSSIKAEYEKLLKQDGVKGFKQRKEIVFSLIEN